MKSAVTEHEFAGYFPRRSTPSIHVDQVAFAPLRENLANDIPMHVSQTKVSSSVAIR